MSTRVTYMAFFREDGDAGFEELVNRSATLPLVDHIPKIVHYVHSHVRAQTWRDYAVIRSALDNIGASKVIIWVSKDAELLGEMWERILRLPNVTAREVPLPDIVWGKKVEKTEHISDLARIIALFEDGGTVVIPHH